MDKITLTPTSSVGCSCKFLHQERDESSLEGKCVEED
jgi:hypothetical protein